MVPPSEKQPPTASTPDFGGRVLTLNGSGSDITRVKWIEDAVAASGTAGMLPPEIFRAAEKEGVHMHKNYPYIVLRKLVEKERLIKRRGRYYRKEN